MQRVVETLEQDLAQRESNREKYPDIAEFVDRLREVFGEVRVMRVVSK